MNRITGILTLAILIPDSLIAQSHGGDNPLPASWDEIDRLRQASYESGVDQGIRITCQKMGGVIKYNSAPPNCVGPHIPAFQSSIAIAGSIFREVDLFDFSLVNVPNTTTRIALDFPNAEMVTPSTPYFIGVYPEGLNMEERSAFIGSFDNSIGDE